MFVLGSHVAAMDSKFPTCALVPLQGEARRPSWIDLYTQVRLFMTKANADMHTEPTAFETFMTPDLLTTASISQCTVVCATICRDSAVHILAIKINSNLRFDR